MAVNCCVAPTWTEAVAGETVIEVRTGTAVTVTLAALLTTLPLVAVTVNGPPAVVAENRPVLPMVPPPLADHVNVCPLIV